MRIIYLHQYFHTPNMPGGTRSYEMALRLVRVGHEVHMITSERTPARARQRGWRVEEIDGITVHWVPVAYSNRMTFSRRLVAFAVFAWTAARRAASLQADLVFATSTPLTIALPGVYAARKRNVPMVLEVRDLWPAVPIAIGALRDPLSRWLARLLERFAYRNAARIVALSRDMKQGVVDAGYPAKRVTVIPNGCDLELFDVGRQPGAALRQCFGWLGDRPMVLYMGALGMINGVGYLARLAAAVHERDPEIRFVVVGTGREEGKVRELACRLGVLDVNFFMIGPVPKRDTPAWLAAADLATSLVIDVPATWSNSANKFFDTLAARKPIAINHGGWQADLLRESGAGLVLDAHEMDTAAQQLITALADQGWLLRAGAAAGRLAQAKFSRDRLAAQLEQVLHSAWKETSARPGDHQRARLAPHSFR